MFLEESLLDIVNQMHRIERGKRLLATLALCAFALSPSAALADCLGMALHSHRGSDAAPENSLSAVRLALDGNWDGVEIDIQQLRDRQWVLHHDPRLGRTTSLQGRMVRDIDSNAWREVRLRDRRGRLVGEHAPFLGEVLEAVAARSDKVLNVEIKQINGSCEAAQQAAAELSRGLPGGHWFLTAIDRRQLQCIRRFDPDVYLGQIVLDGQALARKTGLRPSSFRVPPTVLDSAWLQRMQREVGGPVGVHVDINTLKANPNLLADAGALNMAVFTYHLGPDKEHAAALSAYASRSGLLPSGAIIDGNATAFCNLISSR